MALLSVIKEKLFYKLRFLDFIFIGIVIVSSILIIRYSFNKIALADKVVVSANGNVYEYSLEKDGIYSVEGSIGITQIQIKNGRVRIIDSCCPNKTCVKQGEGHTIICLPNLVYVNVESEEGFDAIVQ